VAAALAVACLACDLPHDPDGTLERVQNGVLRVGVAANAPWIALDGTRPTGYEGAMLQDLAGQLHSSIELHPGAESVLLEELRDRKLDLVAGGLTADSPWKRDVAMTNPYHKDRQGKQHVLAVAPGENRWLVRVDRYLHDNERRLEAIPE
jgi:ABC-type amino acid transport substrate-binding protein